MNDFSLCNTFRSICFITADAFMTNVPLQSSAQERKAMANYKGSRHPKKLSVQITRNFHYPQVTPKQNVAGVVMINFMVESHCNISKVPTDNSAASAYTEQAVHPFTLILLRPGLRIKMMQV